MDARRVVGCERGADESLAEDGVACADVVRVVGCVVDLAAELGVVSWVWGLCGLGMGYFDEVLDAGAGDRGHCWGDWVVRVTERTETVPFHG